MKQPNWKQLFLEARELVADDSEMHSHRCGCRDDDPGFVEGPCPGVKESEAFLKRTKHFVKKATE